MYRFQVNGTLLPSVLPFMSGLVTMMRLLMSGCFLQPAGIIIERVGHAAPLAAVADLALGIKLTEVFTADSLVGHHCFPP